MLNRLFIQAAGIGFAALVTFSSLSALNAYAQHSYVTALDEAVPVQQVVVIGHRVRQDS